MTLEDTTNTSYVVSGVFKINAKIWHMSLVDDNPSWPIIKKKAKKIVLLLGKLK